MIEMLVKWPNSQLSQVFCASVYSTDSLISTMVNGTLLNFCKRYEDDLRVIFDHWPKLHLGLDALSNQKILKGVYVFSQYYQYNPKQIAMSKLDEKEVGGGKNHSRATLRFIKSGLTLKNLQKRTGGLEQDQPRSLLNIKRTLAKYPK